MPLALPLAPSQPGEHAHARGPTSRTARVDARGAPVGGASIAAVARMVADPAVSLASMVVSVSLFCPPAKREGAFLAHFFGEHSGQRPPLRVYVDDQMVHNSSCG
jgi:hypothetical protein